jgi:hypothetical protein
MRRERVLKLARWLTRQAELEEGTARVLMKMKAGDPRQCETRARLFREIAALIVKENP